MDDILLDEEIIDLDIPDTCWRCIPGECNICKDVWVWAKRGLKQYVVYIDSPHTKRCHIWYVKNRGSIPVDEGGRRYHLHHYNRRDDGSWDHTDDDCVAALSREEHASIHKHDRNYASGDEHWVRRSLKEGKRLDMHQASEKLTALLTYVREGNDLFTSDVASQLGYADLGKVRRAVRCWGKYYPELSGKCERVKYGVWKLHLKEP